MRASLPQSNPDRQRVNDLLVRLDRLATLLDSRFRVPGTGLRFGLDSLVGLVPVAGDVVGALVSLYFIYEAWKIDAPRPLLLLMARNIAVEVAAGALPVLGDVFDIYWKSNRRNAQLLRNHLYALLPPEPPPADRRGRRLLLWATVILGILGLVFTFYWLSVTF